MRFKTKIITTTVLTLCAFGTQGQTAFSDSDVRILSWEDSTVSGSALPTHVERPVEMRHDTVHLTPEKIRELQENRPLEEFKREIESVVFVPKGQWVTGVSISYSQSNQNKYQFFILEGVSGDTYTFKVTPSLCYMFRDDMGAGLKFAYTRSLSKLENADIVLGAESSYAADHVYSLSQNYYATAFFRNYFSIGKSKRFGFFNEIQCQLGGGQSKFTRGVSEDLTGAYETNFSLNVGIVPGLCLFLNNYSAIEVNVGVLGFSYTDTKTIRDQIYVSRRKSKMANFRINLFSITFGVAFYL